MVSETEDTLDVNVKASRRKPSASRRRRQTKTDVQIYSSSLPPSSLSVSSTPHLPQIQITADQGPSCSVSLSSASLHPYIRPSLSVPTAPPVQHSGLTQSCRYPTPTYPYLNSLPIQTASVNPRVAVPPGFPLPPKPPIPSSHNPYFSNHYAFSSKFISPLTKLQSCCVTHLLFGNKQQNTGNVRVFLVLVFLIFCIYFYNLKVRSWVTTYRDSTATV